MNLYRFEQLRHAQRLLELAELMAFNGDHLAADRKMTEARKLIFAESGTPPPSRSVAVHRSNTGSGSAFPHRLLWRDAAGHREP